MSEANRLAILRALDILDSPPEPSLDVVVELAAHVFDTSTAAITLVDEDRQWLKARTGPIATQTARDVAFCDHTIRSDAVMVVPDALQDSRFEHNPLVQQNPHIRFYAGAPLIVGGARIGALCVIDQLPRAEFSPAAQAKLASLADAVSAILNLRRELKQRIAVSRVLAEQARKLAMAETMAKIGHWAIDLHTQSVFWSEEVYRIHGVDPASFHLDLSTAVEFYLAEDRPNVQQAIDRAIEDCAPFDFKLRIVRRSDGMLRTVTSRGEVTQDANGKAESLFGVFQDITEQENALQQTLRDSELYRLLTQNVTDVITASAPDGTITFASPSVVNLTGYDSAYVLGRKTWEFIAPVDRPRLSLEFAGLLASGAPTAAIEYRILHRDGQEIWVEAQPTLQFDAAGQFSGYHDVLRDISVRKTAQDAAKEAASRAETAFAASRESEARFRLMAENANDMIATMAPDSTVLFVTPAIERLLGYTPEEVIGRKTLALTHPDDIGRVVKFFSKLIEAGPNPPSKAYPFRGLHKDGSWIWLEGQPRIEFDAAGQPLRYQDVVRDISAHKSLEQELKAAKKIAEAAGQAKADFLANMSHELRTPLSSIIGFADVLVARPGLGLEERRYAGLIHGAGRRLLGIVNDVLDLAKIEAGGVQLHAAAVDLVPLAADTIEMLRLQAAEKGLRLLADLPRAPVVVLADADRLRQILLNLLGNAVKFTAEGTVSLVLKCTETAEGITVALTVTDTGIGIPSHRIKRLFERFEQADNSISRQYGGTGLGLAICRTLVLQMGGTIEAVSELGQGTCFSLQLLFPAARLDAAPPPSAIDVRGVFAGLRVLVAEDVKLNQELIGIFLKPTLAAIDFVGNGAEAVSAADAHAYDIIMMDMQMPVVDGLEACRRIRAGAGQSRAAPIVAITASVLPEEVARVREAGMDDHLGKPFQAADLIAIIGRWAGAGGRRPS